MPAARPDWIDFFVELQEQVSEEELPSVNTIRAAGGSAFAVLVASLISLRTRDDVTLRASRRLLETADTPDKMLKLTPEEIEKKIYPTGFYRTKAKHLLALSEILKERYGGQVPDTYEALKELPGIGPKAANLVLSVAFGHDAICVDTHVHRIVNRMGWVTTPTPEKTEAALMRLIPKDHWNLVNEAFVQYGQTICLPASPHCSQCVFTEWCPKESVLHQR